jgi:glyoxylase-like metal-dependent hydrolase (beta-lactamase superfamily II)
MSDDTSREAPKAGASIIPVTPFQQNCTLLWCETTKKAVVVDPGGDVLDILNAVKQAGVKVEHIWLTHGHVDHVGGAAELRDHLKVPITGPHIADKFLLDNVVETARNYGLTGLRDVTPDTWLNEGDTVSVGELTFDLLHCPGHSPGSIVFFSKALKFAIMGDVLFNGSIGRTDLPYGDQGELLASIRRELLTLPPETRVLPGHGGPTTVAAEAASNPFL